MSLYPCNDSYLSTRLLVSDSVRQPLNAGMSNELAWRMGEACRTAADASAGDLIDRGLALLHALNEKGFDVVPRISEPT